MPTAKPARELTKEEKKKSALYKKDSDKSNESSGKIVKFEFNHETTRIIIETDNEEKLSDILNAIKLITQEPALNPAPKPDEDE